MGNQPKQCTHILFIPYTVLTDLKDTAWLLADIQICKQRASHSVSFCLVEGNASDKLSFIFRKTLLLTLL